MKEISEAEVLQHLIQTDDDVQFEEETLRNPYSLKTWWLYIDFKKPKCSPVMLNVIYERAVRALPGSYKLWFAYLDHRTQQIKNIPTSAIQIWDDLNQCYERALFTMHKMPRIWLDYCKILIRQHKITETRRTFDRALRALPVSQHTKIWKSYLDFVRLPFVPAETGMRVYRRFVQQAFEERIEDWVEYMIERNLYNDACEQLVALLNNDAFTSSRGKNARDLWNDLSDIITKYPEQIKSINVEHVIRGGITRYPAEVGQLWCSLATYYINMDLFEKARDVLEEGLESVATVADYNLIYDTFAKFEEGVVQQKMRSMDLGEEEENDTDAAGGDEILTADEELEMRMARLEFLMDRRPLLLSSVKLRQNPHNVYEWHKRAKIHKEDPEKVVLTFSEALQTVDPMVAIGKPHTLWCAFARFYETRYEDIETARTIFEKAVVAPFKHVDDLASVWSEYAEMEIRNGNLHRAKDLLHKALTVPSTRHYKSSAHNEPVQKKIFKSTKLWSLLADLEESIGTFETTRAVYEKMMDIKVITPPILLSYAQYLEENKHFEDAFKVYEKGVSLFLWPQVYHIWIMYLTKFVKRYGSKKLERARDLFEQAVKNCPRENAKTMFLLYAKLEEDYGLAKHAMAIYNRATRAVKDDEEILDIYKIYISRTAEYYGVTRTREIYENAINSLPDKVVKELCLAYAELERKLGEIDRARAIFAHASRFADPRVDNEFWKSWESFEQQHGNVETFKDMLRIRKSVLASFSTQNVMTAAMLEAEKEREKQHKLTQQRQEAKRKADEALRALEEEAERAQGANEGEEETNEEEINLSFAEVPQAVFTNNIRQNV